MATEDGGFELLVVGGDAVVAAEVGEPGFIDKRFDESFRIFGILEDSPCQSPAAEARLSEMTDSAKEFVHAVGLNAILNGDQDRVAGSVGGNRGGVRPMMGQVLIGGRVIRDAKTVGQKSGNSQPECREHQCEASL